MTIFLEKLNNCYFCILLNSVEMPRRQLTDEQWEQFRVRRLECDRKLQQKQRLNLELRAVEQERNTIA